jgi:hypothetical protein
MLPHRQAGPPVRWVTAGPYATPGLGATGWRSVADGDGPGGREQVAEEALHERPVDLEDVDWDGRWPG